eukprot:GFUD01001863.1.p1 GENE.GFUD01001863.1~~GFUD01001863.1.p1  ORF type:complete len:192 (-),score=48.89 GFUD01001863.1:311-886(-)
MEKNKSSKGRKRSAPPPIEDFLWECTICTYKNNPEAFKCIMCGVSKGTSTRKSRITPDHLAVQVQQALLPPPSVQKPRMNNSFGEHSSSQDEPSSSHKKKSTPKPRKPRTTKARSQLENIDPTSATTMNITVDDVTIPITEYKLKKNTPSDTSRESSASREPLNVNKTINGEPSTSTSTPIKQESDEESDS